ncbi:MAG: Folylpolyglutamate synthase [Syntrophomonadaceae bacterium]|nr:Folylpolyglutamate synthase [Bacillota bacterium]
MKYEEAIVYLYSLGGRNQKFRLTSIRTALGLFGNPHLKLRSIHVSGTNGKGSTASFISSILRSAGYKVGTYTSPHLTKLRERIAINGVLISRRQLAKLVAEVRGALHLLSKAERLTFFETVTIIAFLFFARQKVDFLVCEVGIEGKFDATVVLRSIISVVTNVELDHTNELGKTVAKIAREQIGIIRKDSILVTASRQKALSILKEICRKKGATLLAVGENLKYTRLKYNLGGETFTVKGTYRKYSRLQTTLIGMHQVVNATTAIGAVEALRNYGIPISPASIREGLKRAKWEGRFEIIRKKPLIVLDGAHNPSAANALRKTLADLGLSNFIMVIGILNDKDAPRIIAKLAPLATEVVVTQPQTKRAIKPHELANEAKKHISNVTIRENTRDAISYALTKSSSQAPVCITGSLYLVGEAKQYFNSQLQY